MSGRRYTLASTRPQLPLRDGRPQKRHRLVRLLAPALPQDVRSYILASGIRDGLLFGREVDGVPWRTHDWNKWRKRV
jgi:hypothetical protein